MWHDYNSNAFVVLRASFVVLREKRVTKCYTKRHEGCTKNHEEN